MLRPVMKLAASPKGRVVILKAVTFARSEEGRKLATRTAKVAKQLGEAAKKRENQERVKAAAKLLRERTRR